MKVLYVANTESGSRLKIEADVDPIVMKMIAWVLMSDTPSVQPLVNAFEVLKASEAVNDNA